MNRVIALMLVLTAVSVGQAYPPPATRLQVIGTVIDGATVVKPTSLAASIDGRAAKVESVVSAAESPLIFAVLLDISASLAEHQKYEEEAALGLFKNLSVGSNVGYFGDFNEELYLSRKPASVQSVMAELHDIRRFIGGTALYDAVEQTGKLVSREAKGNGRRAIFVFTDGNDNVSGRNVKSLVADLQRYGVPVFCIELTTSKTSPKTKSDLRTLADSTGGLVLSAQQNVVPFLVALMKNQLWLSVSAPIAPDGKLHSINIETTGESRVVVAKATILK